MVETAEGVAGTGLCSRFVGSQGTLGLMNPGTVDA